MPEATPFLLRRLTSDDIDRAALVLRTSFDAQLPWLAGLHTVSEDRAYFQHQVFPTSTVWGAIEREVIIGIIVFRVGWVDALYVMPTHQGRGVGSALLDVAKAASPASLQLWTFQRNEAARHFYAARGFVVRELTDGQANEEREPDVQYQWDGSPRVQERLRE